MLTAESWDGGASWGNVSVVSSISRSVGVGVYDTATSTVVFQYQSFNQSNPYVEGYAR